MMMCFLPPMDVVKCIWFQCFFILFINLSQNARTAGNNVKIKIVEHSVPSEIVLHIFAAMAEAKLAIIRVTIISIELEVNIV